MSSPPPHQPYQQPVNFGENPSTSSRYSHDFTGGVHNAPDTSTVYSYPVGRPQSGVTAYERDPYADPYEGGETHAQAVASEYTRSLSSPRDASSPFDSQGIRRADTKKSAALSYVDENFNYYRSTPDAQDAALVHNVADVAGHEHNQSNSNFDLEYSDPYGSRNMDEPSSSKGRFATYLDQKNVRYPIEQQIANKQRGVGRQKYPVVVWTLTVAMSAVIIYELVVNWKAQGTPFSFKPFVNPMLGPSQSALINVGARFPPCMKLVAGVPIDTQLGCLNNTANPPTSLCTLEEICGFGGFKNGVPNQWFRFITPVFLHAGLVHILLNMFAQLTLSAQVEREMGSAGFVILYFCAGIWGNVLGGNFSLVGAPSVGASGAIFGTVAVMWVDLFAHWRYEARPKQKLVMLIIELVIGLALGYIPGVDNFAHIGGFTMGLLGATVFYPVISETKRHKAIMWGFRIAALPIVIVLFVILIRNFYTSDPYVACKWCRYLSCIPTAANNRCQGTGITTTTSTTV